MLWRLTKEDMQHVAPRAAMDNQVRSIEHSINGAELDAVRVPSIKIELR